VLYYITVTHSLSTSETPVC